jgi:hypothetical protein
MSQFNKDKRIFRWRLLVGTLEAEQLERTKLEYWSTACLMFLMLYKDVFSVELVVQP